MRADHFYAYVSDYPEFDSWVPFAEGGYYYESALRKPDGSTNKGAFGRAVRNLSDEEFDLILARGFAHALGGDQPSRPAPDVPAEPRAPVPGLSDERPSFDYEPPLTEPRRIEERLVARSFRDRAFAAAVKAAYRDTCAVTGIRIINGGGRSEAQAAHIRPVALNGPDSVRNGVALSGTIHWMFDRGLLSIDDDHGLLISRNRIPEVVARLLPRDGRLTLPERQEWRPHPGFLRFHREHVFKG